jgi:arylsulfatase A-like enzyme
MLLLTARAGARGSDDDSDIGGGARAEAVHAFIEKRYASEVRRVALALSATAIAIGVSLGLLALLIVWLRGKPRRTPTGRFVESLALVAGLHAAFFAYGMAKAPQLYAAKFYAQGGLWRLAQILATDTLGRAGVVLVSLAIALFYARPHLLARVRVMRSRTMRIVKGALRTPGRAAAVSALFFSGAWLAWTLPDVPSARADGGAATRPNVLILAADSLRDDHVTPRTMPNLARYADKSARFTRAYVSLPRTFSSWVTLLTGRYAYHHGVRSMFPRWEDRAKDLDALPERLAREGYSTGVVSDYAGDIFGRVDLGFQLTDTPGFDFRTLVRQRALERETPLLPFLHGATGRKMFPVLKELNDAADPQMLAGDVRAALKKFRGKPFFLTVFFSTAHFPYAAPAPYYGKFASPEYRGRYKYHKPVGLAHELPPDDDDIRQVRALYDGATSAIDDAMQSVLDDLESLGLAKDTIVVVTADHGETLFEDGHGQGHGDHLFGDEGTHVPLIIHDPRDVPGAPRRAGASKVDGITRDVDVAPTLYDLVGVKKPEDLDGVTLAPQIAGEPLAPRTAFAESELWFTEEIPALPPTMRMPYPGIFGLTEIDSQHGDEIVLRKNMVPLTTMARHRMAKDDKWKLVYVPTREGVKYMLFDTVDDRAETEDVAAAHPNEVARLRAELFSWMLRDPRAKLSGGFVVPQEGGGEK